ncbi:alkaline phosphatase [Sphingosinicella sp. CPCC 101087]|uniref:alkaline phosphatase n=1 Tax=Sphingosinicella sp. CPCC 101087 TaxID=2497754 RepID=UPI00101CC8EA|nr:alkaline phosphatase [Sphingosinicella sp. CPCC 101087]
MILPRFIACTALSALLSCTAFAQGHPMTTEAYRAQADAELDRLRAEPPVVGRARNIILFIGDGMGVSTLTAARIHQGQRQGVDGESYVPAMDRLSHTALVKTYSHDAQVSDSAPTATAIMTGVKTRNGVIGVGPEVAENDCAASRRHTLPSLFGLAQSMGLATGIISTARITHATPAAAYAHTPQRDWEADGDVPEAARQQGCTDIARQMIEGEVGSRLDLVLGGGRANFLPTSAADPEYRESTGKRTDGRDLMADWRRRNPAGAFVWNQAGFAAVDLARTPRLLGLFEPDHMRFESDRPGDAAGEPSLAEMTRTAITMLGSRETGYVLLVEGGRIDHAHHAGNARRALEDTVALDAAVRTALEMTRREDTLILVTADHSHVFTISGYPERGNPILGLAGAGGAPFQAGDGKSYTTLGYANGPGAVVDAPRTDPAEADTGALDYRQQALVPLGAETHAGEDVVARASGPMAHLVKGTIEQHTLFYLMREALTGGSGN